MFEVRVYGFIGEVYRSPLIWLYGLELGYHMISTLTLQAVD